jgi:NADH:ubiquinone oxidoreductase subunit 6 (subunit J)
LGALLAGLALMVAMFLILRTGVLSPETGLFYAFAALAIVAGVLLVTQRNPARAALSFALVVLSTCGLFLLLAAPFLMAATIIIYAGAIIVTFLFVLMLASQTGITDADARTREPLLATALGFLLLGCLIYVLQVSYEENETVREIGKLLSTRTKPVTTSARTIAATTLLGPSTWRTISNEP